MGPVCLCVCLCLSGRGPGYSCRCSAAGTLPGNRRHAGVHERRLQRQVSAAALAGQGRLLQYDSGVFLSVQGVRHLTLCRWSSVMRPGSLWPGLRAPRRCQLPPPGAPYACRPAETRPSLCPHPYWACRLSRAGATLAAIRTFLMLDRPLPAGWWRQSLQRKTLLRPREHSCWEHSCWEHSCRDTSTAHPRGWERPKPPHA